MNAHHSPQPTVLRCTTSLDFLASLPLLLGYTVTNSLVVTLFEGGRTSQAMRIDLPDVSVPFHDTGLDLLISRVCRSSKLITAVALVVYTDESFGESEQAPRRLLMLWLERELERLGLIVKDLVCVAADRWAPYHDASATRGGRPLDEIASVTAELSSRHPIDAPTTSISALGALPATDDQFASALAQALRETSFSTSLPIGDVERFVERCEHLLQHGFTVPLAREAADLVHLSNSATGWGLVLLTLVVGGGGVLEWLADERDTAPTTPLANGIAQIEQTNLVGFLSAQRPASPELRTAIAHLSTLCACTPEHARSGVHGLLAWSWWLSGLTSPALTHLEQAGSSETEAALAKLARAAVASGPPLWVYGTSD